jgi:titin
MKHTVLLLSSILILSGLFVEANAAIPPGPPAGFSATAVSSTQINLFWSAPTNTGDSPVLGYKIEFKTGSGTYEVLIDNTSNTYYYHTGRTTGQSYTYRVSAVNTAGVGTASNEITVTPTSSSTASLPGSPTGLSAVPVSPTQINLS